MSAPAWDDLEALFHQALALPPSARPAFLADRCAGRPDVQAEVEAMLRAHDAAASGGAASPVATYPALQGARLGAYQVLSQLGAGGMGEVYRARDTRLGREVAIKILPPAFAADAERGARFEREARVLAALNHPNIAVIHGIEDSAIVVSGFSRTIRALVLELVEGLTLADRIARGPLAVDEALAIARQIAEALEAAHEKGIVHRDLKPANIKITPKGIVKVLDFGLAKIFASAGAIDVSQTPTITVDPTQAGTITGTPAYMSPEQARGQSLDKQTDIWAFGCVLYEMLTGRAAFTGDSISDVLAAVLTREPDLTALPGSTPSSVRQLLRRCLRKDQAERLHDIADARIEIQDAQSEAGGAELAIATHPAARRARSVRVAWIVASLAALVAVVLAAVTASLISRPLPPARELRLEIATPPTTDPLSLALSPDGEKLVFVADSDGISRLWVRELNAVSARALPGSDGAAFPFWSPDSRSIGFFADGKLKRLDLAGGAPQVLADATIGRGGAWNRDGVIIFAPGTALEIFRVPATGGEAVAITRRQATPPDEVGHRFPQFLPDGRRFVFHVVGSAKYRGVYMASLDDPTMHRFLDTDTAAVVTPEHLLFVREGTLFAQRFDAGRRQLVGSPISVAEQIVSNLNIAAVSASTGELFGYRSGESASFRQFIWFDRAGNRVGTVGDPDAGNPYNPQLSPDGRRLAMNRTTNGNADIWLMDIEQSTQIRFTFDRVLDAYPVWSPDGRRIAFVSNRDAVGDVYVKPTSGAGAEARLLATPQQEVPHDWSSDGRFLLYRAGPNRPGDPSADWDLWVLPVREDEKPFPVVQTNFDERDGQFSPDGRWMAYESNESGRYEVYVQTFPGPGGKWQISTNGGAQVRWRPDGKELFYIGLDGRLMAVSFRLSLDGQTVEPSTPVPLFVTRTPGGPLQGGFRQQYAVSPDGQRFLINSEIPTAASPITLVLNWKPPQ